MSKKLSSFQPARRSKTLLDHERAGCSPRGICGILDMGGTHSLPPELSKRPPRMCYRWWKSGKYLPVRSFSLFAPYRTSPLGHPRHTQPLIYALAFEEEGRVVTQCTLAEAA